jgi:hypothetical protein
VGHGSVPPIVIPPADRRLVRASWVLLSAVLAVAIVLRFVALDHLPGVNGDEAVFPVHASEWRGGVPLAELRTGTNLPMNPVFFGVVALLGWLLPASLWTLRLAAVIESLLAVGLGFWAFRVRGLGFAALFALLVAVLPIQLGYARLAWDPTAVPAVMVLALAAAIRGRWIATALAFGLCLWVHPTSVFAAPILFSALLAAKWPRLPDGAIRWPSRRVLAFLGVGAVVAVAGCVWLVQKQLLPAPVVLALERGLLAKVEQRATHPGDFPTFLLLYLDFVGGPTIYRYLTGSMPALAAGVHATAAGVALLAVVAALLRRRSDPARAIDRGVLLGLGLSLVAAYLGGGLEVIAPYTERYSMFLVTPTCFVLAAGIDTLARTPRRAAFARIGTAVVGALLLLSFQTYFFRAFRHADPERHVTYRTGRKDPKQGAFEEVVSSRAPDHIALIRAEDWWIYWPLRYLAGPPGDVQVTIPGWKRWNWRYPHDFPPRPDPRQTQVFDVVWAGSARDAACASTAEQTTDIGGYEPGPILRVHRQPLAGAH